MAAGKEHVKGYKIGLGILGAVGVAAIAQGAPFVYGVSLLVGGVLGLLIDPDLRDQCAITTHSERRMAKIPVVGRFTGWAWQVYWYPLSRFITHRSFLSHLPGVATALAAFWTFVPWTLAIWLFQYGSANGYLDWVIMLWQPWWWWIFAGWVLQDCIHFIQDGGRIKWRL